MDLSIIFMLLIITLCIGLMILISTTTKDMIKSIKNKYIKILICILSFTPLNIILIPIVVILAILAIICIFISQVKESLEEIFK